MKILWVAAFFILSIAFLSCSNKEKDEAESNQTKEGLVKESDSKSLVQKNEKTGEQKRITETETTVEKAGASFEAKVQKGEIFMLTNDGEPEPFKFAGSKITAMKLPDGKLYQVEEKGDRTMINIPGKGEMGIIKLYNKFYLFDDKDQAYEVKFINKQLFAEKTDLTDVLVKK